MLQADAAAPPLSFWWVFGCCALRLSWDQPALMDVTSTQSPPNLSLSFMPSLTAMLQAACLHAGHLGREHVGQLVAHISSIFLQCV